MEVEIRHANPQDMTHVLRLIKELALFEKEPDQVVINLNDLLNDGFNDPKRFTCFVAEKGVEIVGMALVYFRYSTWKGCILHLEDLIVSEPYRGHGIGSQLLETVFAYGASKNVKRISWEVLDWNAPAIAFYKSKGAIIKEEWRVVHFPEKEINKYKHYN